MLYEEPKENFSIEEIKQIITGCIVFLEILRLFPKED